MIELFKTGFITYPEEIADKPVKYTEEDLKAVAFSTSQAKLKREHTDEVIGTLENFIYKDGFLYVNEPEGIDLKGMGLSPSFEFALKDMGEYYVPWDIRLIDVGLTKNPRSRIFYNSIIEEEKNGDVTMEEKEKLLNQIQANQEEIRNQQEEIGILRNRNKALDESLKKKNELEQKLKDKEAEYDKLQSEYDKLKPYAESFAELQAKKKDELVTKLANGDAELTEKYSKMSIEDLEFWSEKNILNTKPKGVGSNEEPLDDEEEPQRMDDIDPTYDEYLEFKARQGIR